MEDKLKLAGKIYGEGFTCSQAVFCAFSDDMGIDRLTALRIMDGFGMGIGGMQEVCGALAAASAIIGYYSSDGTPDSEEKRQIIFQGIQEAAELFRQEYGGITCREVLRGRPPKAFQCGMKVKDMVLICNHILTKNKLLNEET